MGKLIRAVLRGRNGGNTVLLPDKYEQDGVPRKVYGFTAILCYSRMRFVTFVKRCDGPTMIRCLMEAFEYFGGLPKAALTDRMKSVLVVMEGKIPRWNARFADAHGLHRSRTTRLSGVHAPNEGQNREISGLRQTELLGRGVLQRS
jgi:integrase-like protein